MELQLWFRYTIWNPKSSSIAILSSFKNAQCLLRLVLNPHKEKSSCLNSFVYEDRLYIIASIQSNTVTFKAVREKVGRVSRLVPGYRSKSQRPNSELDFALVFDNLGIRDVAYPATRPMLAWIDSIPPVTLQRIRDYR